MGDETNQSNIEVESEWKRIDKLLSQKSEASWTVAVIEAHKTFRRVLQEVSFGETTDDQVHNASELFKDMASILTANQIYEQIINETNYKIIRKDAKKATNALLQAILDMIGRDFESQGFWHRLANSMNFFWGHHPKSLIGLLAGLLVFVIAVWFLADTVAGQWVVELVVGFARFVLSWTVLVVLLAAALLIAVALSFAYFERRKR